VDAVEWVCDDDVTQPGSEYQKVASCHIPPTTLAIPRSTPDFVFGMQLSICVPFVLVWSMFLGISRGPYRILFIALLALSFVLSVVGIVG